MRLDIFYRYCVVFFLGLVGGRNESCTFFGFRCRGGFCGFIFFRLSYKLEVFSIFFFR